MATLMLTPRCVPVCSLSRVRSFWSLASRLPAPTSSSAAPLSGPAPRILVTGSTGQIGTELVSALRARYGVNNVVASDIKAPPRDFPEGPFVWADVMNYGPQADTLRSASRVSTRAVSQSRKRAHCGLDACGPTPPKSASGVLDDLQDATLRLCLQLTHLSPNAPLFSALCWLACCVQM